MRRALVTGAGGFIGRYVVSELKRRDVEVRALHFRQEDIRTGPLFRLDASSETDELADLLAEAKPETIFHLAGSSHPQLLFDLNVGFAVRLIDGVRRSGIGATILLAGSAAEYGRVDARHLPVSEDRPCRPLTPYGTSKHAQTVVGLAAAAVGTRVVVARLFNVVGRGMAPHLPLADISIRLAASESDGKLLVGDLDLERDFVDVADVAGSLVGLASHPGAAGHVFNFCSGHGIWLRQLVERMAGSVPWPVTLVATEPTNRPNSVRRMVGLPDKLVQLGFSIPTPDFDALLPAIVEDAMNQSASPRPTIVDPSIQSTIRRYGSLP
jgi:GDP-4-dehydro-6-deoxy-D-mannose reductase